MVFANVVKQDSRYWSKTKTEWRTRGTTRCDGLMSDFCGWAFADTIPTRNDGPLFARHSTSEKVGFH
jgi:hypothetical protein